jgi:hypothetical protein
VTAAPRTDAARLFASVPVTEEARAIDNRMGVAPVPGIRDRMEMPEFVVATPAEAMAARGTTIERLGLRP